MDSNGLCKLYANYSTLSLSSSSSLVLKVSPIREGRKESKGSPARYLACATEGARGSFLGHNHSPVVSV